MVVQVTIEDMENKGTPSKTIVDGNPSISTPSTVVVDSDDLSVASSASGASGRRNPFNKKGKKPRAEYQKKIDNLKKWNGNLKEENDLLKQDFAKLKEWVMSAPVPGGNTGLEVAEEEVATSWSKSPAASKNTRIFGKKPRAEYQKEIDALDEENENIKMENDRLKANVADLHTWYLEYPM